MSQLTRTTCPYCGVGCGVLVSTDEEGGVTIKGDPDHPANLGRLCSKGAALGETLGLEGRLLYPQVDGQQVGWDEALDAVAQRFTHIIEGYGPDAVALYVSGQLLTEDYYVANKLMKGYIGSANIDTNSRLCMSSAVSAYKRAFGSDTVPCGYEDLERAKLIVITGSNTAWCHPVVYQRIVKAKQQHPDLRVVVIDPRRTATCDIADLHLPLTPGSDAWLFNGLLAYIEQKQEHNPLFIQHHTEGAAAALAAARDSAPDCTAVADRCGLSLQQVTQFFELFARTERVVTLFSQGVNQSSSGTDKGNAIINCHLLTGRIGRPGMGPFSITGQPNAMGGREVGGLANQLAAHMEITNPLHRERVQRFWNSPTIVDHEGKKAVDLFHAIESGEIKAVWIMATNPVVSLPEADRVKAALQRCELVVVSDTNATTDTVALAHIRLPALGWGEKGGTVTNSERRISRQRPFIAAPAEARADWQALCGVAERMGFSGFEYGSVADIFREHAQLTAFENNGERVLNLAGLCTLDDGHYEALEPLQWPINEAQQQGSARVFSDGHFFTASGRAQLLPVTPRGPAHTTNADYPLILNTGRVRDQWHTMTRSGSSPRLAAHTQEPYAEIHPQDAVRYQIEEAMLVRVTSRDGVEVIVRAKVSEQQQRGSLFVPIHWSSPFSAQARIDTLVAAVTDPISGQPESKHAPVSIAPYLPHWYGFLLSRRQLTPDAHYWSRSAGKGLWRYQLAGDQPPDDWAASARTLLCDDDRDVGWIEYLDSATAQYRAARLVHGQLESCLYIGPGRELPPHDWLEPLFTIDRIDHHQRLALLAGRPLEPTVDAGPAICACYGVGRQTVIDTIQAKGLTTVEEIGTMFKAGTNCGSCIPELKQLLAASQPG